MATSSTPPAPVAGSPATTADGSAEAPTGAEVARGAGRGVLFIAFAKVYFMIVGFAIQAGLTRFLSTAMYGLYGAVNAWVSPLNNVMVTGSIQAVSRFAAQRPEHARAVAASGMRMHLYIGVPVALVFAAASPLIAWFQHDWNLLTPLLISGFVVAGYAFYAVLVGLANGTRAFHKQAGLDVTFASLRGLAMLGAAALGLGVVGVFAGWVAAVVAIIVVAAVWVGWPRARGDAEPVGAMAKFFVGVAVYLVLFNVLMFADTWLLKRLATEHYVAHQAEFAAALELGVPWVTGALDYHPAASDLANVQVGHYTAVQQLARLSYQAIIAVTFVIFPLVSRSTFAQDSGATRTYVQVTLRYSLIFSMLIAIVMIANPTPVLDIVFPADYAELGGPALAALALGNVAFSLFAIAGTILNGAGATGPAIISAAVTLVLAVVGNVIALNLVPPGAHMLLAAAAVTGAAMVVGAVVSGVFLYRRLGAAVPWRTIGRVGVAAAVAVGVARLVPFRSPLMALVEAGLVAVVFLGTLIVTGELGRGDRAAIASVRKKRAPAGEQP